MKAEIFDIPPRLRGNCLIDAEDYLRLYEESITEPELFWEKMADEFVQWDKQWQRVLEWDYAKGHIGWFLGGRLNVSVNCLDRHLSERGEKTAIIWEGNEPGDVRALSYRELHDLVCRFANVLRDHGIKKGDRVALYLPMVPELAAAMLACARIGAIHSVVFAGFSAEALRGRVLDLQCALIVTSNVAFRGQKTIELKEIVDQAIEGVACVRTVLVHERTAHRVHMQAGRDIALGPLLEAASSKCAPESMDSEDPLFVLYTSGSTGKPKGVLHTQGGYLVYASVTHKFVFDYREEDVYFCAADCGWITGHTYVVYGPLANGATTLMFESIPTYPDAGRYFDVIDRHKVSIFYTAPTAIRTVAKEGDHLIHNYDLGSLRILGSVGEPINRDAWLWYFERVGKERCTIVDTWWQTETGGILITPLPGATALKPGSATRPFFGIRPCIVDEQGHELHANGVQGRLCISFPWPGQMRTVYGDHQRFIDTYFSQFPGKYFTGDACIRDDDGYYWITGRVDDVLNVSGHRLGTAEIESAIMQSGIVAEAAVVGMPHEIKGTGIYAYCVLKESVPSDDRARASIIQSVRRVIGAFASPDVIQFAKGLPKTRSGKIMRRILRKIASQDTENLGDISTLADPSVVAELIERAPRV